MTNENVSIIEIVLNDAIERCLNYSEIRGSEGNEEAMAILLAEANLVKGALNEFLKENRK